MSIWSRRCTHDAHRSPPRRRETRHGHPVSVPARYRCPIREPAGRGAPGVDIIGSSTCMREEESMSLRPEPVGPVPEETARAARAAFAKGNAYMQLRDVLGVVYQDERFAGLFPARGRPAEAPWRLALVTVMQFAEGLSDRQAAEAVRGR